MNKIIEELKELIKDKSTDEYKETGYFFHCGICIDSVNKDFNKYREMWKGLNICYGKNKKGVMSESVLLVQCRNCKNIIYTIDYLKIQQGYAEYLLEKINK